mgnify:FL=1
MAYQSGKTYYLVPRFWVSSTTSRENILNKKTKPLALNTKGTGGHYNNRDCNLWTLDYSTDMQWKVEIPAEGGYARILCAGDTSYGLDYYYAKDNKDNCDIYKVAGNENDSKVNFITISAANNYYRIQCYRNNTGNNLYLTAVRNSNGKFDNGCDVRWCALDPKIPMEQTWWLLPVEDVKEGTTNVTKNINLRNSIESYNQRVADKYKEACAGICACMALKLEPDTVPYDYIAPIAYWQKIGDIKNKTAVRYDTSSLKDVYNLLSQNIPVIVQTRTPSNSSYGYHWVIIYGFNGDPNNLTASSFKCIDPWGTDENTPNGNDCALSNSSHFVAISAVAYYK